MLICNDCNSKVLVKSIKTPTHKDARYLVRCLCSDKRAVKGRSEKRALSAFHHFNSDSVRVAYDFIGSASVNEKISIK